MIYLFIYFITVVVNFIIARLTQFISYEVSLTHFIIYMALSPFTIFHSVGYSILRDYYAKTVYNQQKDDAVSIEDAELVVAEIVFDTAESLGYPLATFEEAYTSTILNLVKRIKEETSKSIWCWTGYNFEDLIKEFVDKGKLVESDGKWSMKN